MRPLFSHIFGIIILLVIVLVTVGVLFNDLTKRSYYTESGTVEVKGISQKVNIYKTELGVPHIFAENEDDMYFSLGYTHAQDRLWQMDISRRVAEGKLSEILGEDVLDYDILFRTIGIGVTANSQYEKISPVSKRILQSYSDGVNAFISAHIKNLPLEFDILNYKPEEWKPQNSLMIVRLMGWELNFSWYSELMFAEIVKKFGLEKAIDFFPNYPDEGPFIINSGMEEVKKDSNKVKQDTLKKAPVKKNTNKKPGETKNKSNGSVLENSTNRLSDLHGDFLEIASSYKNFMGNAGGSGGSNSWVISGEISESGKPMIANDPHLALQVPSKWYEVSLYDNNSKRSVSGFSIPGVPGIAIGHNENIAWGLTNLMNDDSDFLILRRDSANRKNFIYNNASERIDSTTESIKIKDKNDEFTFIRYFTNLGPVISNLEKTGFLSKSKINFNQQDLVMVYRWTGYDHSDEIESFYRINTASSWNDFLNALRSYGTPALNFTYADTSGNIGYIAAGYVPIRTGMADETFPLFPSLNNAIWSGFIPFNELPSVYNPKEGFIITANNKPVKNYKNYISYLYEPPYRAERINEIINSRSILSVEDFKLIQRDLISIQAKEFTKYIFEAYKDQKNISEEEKEFLDLLKSWDYEMRIYSPEASVFSAFEIELYKNLYKDLLGDELFGQYVYIKNIPVRNTSRLLKESKSWIFDLNPGDALRKRNEIIMRSFRDAIAQLKNKFGTDDETKWFWGDVHQVVMKHPLGIVPALSSMLNIGPFKVGGNGTTVSVAEYSFNNAIENRSYECYIAPSMRMIIDLDKIKESYTILPTGQSGQALHKSFNDQARLWLHYNYKEVSTDYEDLKKENLRLLTLEPVN